MNSIVQFFKKYREFKLFLWHYLGWLVIYFTVTLVNHQPFSLYYVIYLIVQPFFLILLVHLQYWITKLLLTKRKFIFALLFIVICFIIFVVFVVFSQEIKYEILGTLNYATIIKQETEKLAIRGLVYWIYSTVFTAIRIYSETSRRQDQLEKEKREAELEALKLQVNPHFLFNTLNNLYGTAIIDGNERTAAGIQQLSSVMRHVVEESKHEKTTIAKELEFIENSIELHRMRIPQRANIRISSHVYYDGKPAEIAPVLLISFIENAFKYGISIGHDCFVDIKLSVENQHLTFSCENTIFAKKQLEASTGTGIENIRKRLQLLYPNKHSLKIEDKNDIFSVNLSIEL